MSLVLMQKDAVTVNSSARCLCDGVVLGQDLNHIAGGVSILCPSVARGWISIGTPFAAGVIYAE